MNQMSSPPASGLDEFEIRLISSGITPDEARLAAMREAWGHLSPMLARLPRDFSFGDEPTTVFCAAAASGMEMK